jgi:GYD domain
MKAHTLVVSALVIGLSLPAMAQQSLHRYVAFFNYSEAAVKAMTETPQDRAAQAAELAESFGGKMEAAYWFPAGSEYDGMVIWTFVKKLGMGQRQGRLPFCHLRYHRAGGSISARARRHGRASTYHRSGTLRRD